MISKTKLRKAMKLHKAKIDLDYLDDDLFQLIVSLDVYYERGEYHLLNENEAIECLELAGYEIKGVK